VVPRPLPAAALAVCRNYLAVVPRPILAALRRYFFGIQAVSRGGTRCALQVLDLGAQADACGAEQVLDRGAQEISRGAALCVTQILDHGAQSVARGAARCASQVLDRGARVGGAVALITVRQGRQRRAAVAAGEEQLAGCAAGRLYPSRRCTWPTPAHV
jgi:hypothetical protein